MLASLVAWLLLAPGAPAVARAAPSGANAQGYAELTARLDALSTSPALVGSKVGFCVQRLDDDVVLYGRNADIPLIPASNVKIVTTAAALHFLTPDYRFRTEVYAAPRSDGVVTGPLWLKGYGDPWLVPERVWYLASRVYYAGVREIRGDLGVDDSYFSGERMQNGAEQDKSSSAYMAPAGALSVDFNAIFVHVLPGSAPGRDARILIDPPSEYASISGRISTVSGKRTNANVDVVPEGKRSIVNVSGHIAAGEPGRGFWRRIDNPPIFAGEVVKTMLAKVGVTVRGKVTTGPVPEGTPLLISMDSPRLADVVDYVNKQSNNFMADQIAHALGAQVFGPPGTWDKGRAAIEAFLRNDVGLAPESFKLGNASGLHDVNHLTPRAIVTLLRYMYRQPRLRPEFMASLAVAGGSGTLGERMRETDAAYLLRAKTGTLSDASALSGYVTTKNGQTLAFSILVNDYQTSVQDVWQVQDAMGAVLAALPSVLSAPPKAEPPAVLSSGSPPTQVIVP